jgi:hypothetical protein
MLTGLAARKRVTRHGTFRPFKPIPKVTNPWLVNCTKSRQISAFTLRQWPKEADET